jgi:hypothetical protein
MARLQRLRKNSDFALVLKGCGFSRTAKYTLSTRLQPLRDRNQREKEFFRNLSSRAVTTQNQ